MGEIEGMFLKTKDDHGLAEFGFELEPVLEPKERTPQLIWSVGISL